jgi:hypothetical protein
MFIIDIGCDEPGRWRGYKMNTRSLICGRIVGFALPYQIQDSPRNLSAEQRPVYQWIEAAGAWSWFFTSIWCRVQGTDLRIVMFLSCLQIWVIDKVACLWECSLCRLIRRPEHHIGRHCYLPTNWRSFIRWSPDQWISVTPSSVIEACFMSLWLVWAHTTIFARVYMPSKFAQMVMLLTCIRDVFGSNLGPSTDSPEASYPAFL